MQRAGWRRSLGFATLCAVCSLLSTGLARPDRWHRVTLPVYTWGSAALPPTLPDRVLLSDGASTLRKNTACPSCTAVPILHTQLHAVLPSRSLPFPPCVQAAPLLAQIWGAEHPCIPHTAQQLLGCQAAPCPVFVAPEVMGMRKSSNEQHSAARGVFLFLFFQLPHSNMVTQEVNFLKNEFPGI